MVVPYSDPDYVVFMEVTVNNPITLSTQDEGPHTLYAINVMTNNPAFTLFKSTVKRRYSDFVRLRKLLKDHHPMVDPPSLPPGTFFGFKRFEPLFVEQRRDGLESFIKQVLSIPLYLSNKGLHLFLQTDMAMKDVEAIVSGKTRSFAEHEDLSHVDRNTGLLNISEREMLCCHDCDMLDTASVSDTSSTNGETNQHADPGLTLVTPRICITTPRLIVPSSDEESSISSASSGCSTPDHSPELAHNLPHSSSLPAGLLDIVRTTPRYSWMVNSVPLSATSTFAHLQPVLPKKRVSFSDDVLVAHLTD